jgi:hypothetical protein
MFHHVKFLFIYTLVYTEHASKYTWLYGLKNKDQAVTCLKHLIEVRLPKLGITMKHYHGDGAGELIGSKTTEYLVSRGISYSWSPPDTPELNGMSERKNRTHNEITLCMLTRSDLHRSFWYDAYTVVQYPCNRLPTKTYKGFMTPYEFMNGEPPNMEQIRIWGSVSVTSGVPEVISEKIGLIRSVNTYIFITVYTSYYFTHDKKLFI